MVAYSFKTYFFAAQIRGRWEAPTPFAQPAGMPHVGERCSCSPGCATRSVSAKDHALIPSARRAGRS